VEQVTTSTGLSPSDAWSVATDRSAWRALRPIDGQAERERDIQTQAAIRRPKPKRHDMVQMFWHGMVWKAGSLVKSGAGAAYVMPSWAAKLLVIYKKIEEKMNKRTAL